MTPLPPWSRIGSNPPPFNQQAFDSWLEDRLATARVKRRNELLRAKRDIEQELKTLETIDKL